MSSPKLGEGVKIKPEKAAIRGTLPPELAESLKLGTFEVVKLQTETKTNRPSAALKMPSGVGEEILVNGVKVWAWFVFNDDIAEDEPVKEKPTRSKTTKPAAEAKPVAQKATLSSDNVKAGDIIKAKPGSLLPYCSEEENKKGFRVLGFELGGRGAIVEANYTKGDLRETLGKSTWRLYLDDAILVSEHKLEVGDFVRPKNDFRNELSSALDTCDNILGYKLLEFRGNIAIIEMPSGRGVGYSDYKHPGKRIVEIDVAKIELSPTIPVRSGDKIRIKSEAFPTRINKKHRRQKLEVTKVIGNFRGFEYTVKLADGSSMTVSESGIVGLQKETAKVSSGKYKIGEKVRVKKPNRDEELPDSLSESAKGKEFEVLESDEYDGSVLLKMPKSCEEADWDEERQCRVWYVGKDYLEEKIMAKRGERSERSEMGFGERLSANLEKGAIKTVGRKLTKAIKAGILRALEASAKLEGMNEAQVQSGLAMFTRFMETDFGNAMISAGVGIAIQQGGPLLAQYVEAFQDDRIQDLADEMQSEGSAIVMEKLIDTALEFILPDVSDIMKGLPPKKTAKKDTKVRVATTTASKKKGVLKVGAHEVEVDGDGDEEEEDEENVKIPAQRGRAA